MQIAPFLLLLLVLWIVNLCVAGQYRRLGDYVVRQDGEPIQTAGLPSVTIVLSVHNQAQELRQNLPLLLTQSYPVEYEVIVVDRRSDDETLSLLESMEESYPHLHHTYCPATARDISLQRLALTLGIKSACYEWICILQPDCQVTGNQWLQAIMQPCTPSADAVLGFVRYSGLQGWMGQRWQFFRLWQQMMWLPFAATHAPYRADGACLCYRKSHFLQHQGFASHANLESGAETLLVNHNISRGRCRINVRTQAQVTQPQPEDRMWAHERVFFMETRKHMQHTIPYRLRYFTAVAAQWAYLLLTIGLMVYHLPNWYTVVPLALMGLIVFAVRSVSFNYTANKLGVTGYRFSSPFLMLMIPLWDLQAWVHWLFTRKKTFRKKFV